MNNNEYFGVVKPTREEIKISIDSLNKYIDLMNPENVYYKSLIATKEFFENYLKTLSQPTQDEQLFDAFGTVTPTRKQVKKYVNYISANIVLANPKGIYYKDLLERLEFFENYLKTLPRLYKELENSDDIKDRMLYEAIKLLSYHTITKKEKVFNHLIRKAEKK